MTERLRSFWARVNDVCANPFTAVVVIIASVSWILISTFSHGQIDPGGQVGNYVQNAIQLILLFVTASLASRVASDGEKLHDNHSALHDKIDALVRHLTGKDDAI